MVGLGSSGCCRGYDDSKRGKESERLVTAATFIDLTNLLHHIECRIPLILLVPPSLLASLQAIGSSNEVALRCEAGERSQLDRLVGQRM